MKQLTTNQIKELHKLVERNAIKYYDVEVEIVDHYASAIEDSWEHDPQLLFEEAKERIYKEFWDFKGLQKNKERVLSDLAQKEINLKLAAIRYAPICRGIRGKLYKALKRERDFLKKILQFKEQRKSPKEIELLLTPH